MRTFDRALAFRLAGAASTDWRTAERFLRGETIRGLAGSRLEAAAAQIGLALPALPTMAIASGLPLVAATAAGQLR